MDFITVSKENPKAPDSIRLLEKLSLELESITGSSGKLSFDTSDMENPRAVFLVARNALNEAIGCGALRPIDVDTAEIKRVYAETKKMGVGKQIVRCLEAKAKDLGYSVIWLETRLVNQNAVAFYESLGYNRIPNYGKYKNRPEAVCFEKQMRAAWQRDGR